MDGKAVGTGSIKKIAKAVTHKICSGQVVLNLANAVKELVENSLDAGATNIEIRLKDYGADLIEVADNGSGVSPENFEALTRKYYTSKISEFADLERLSTLGFRGEALSSLCALADVSILTRTKNEPMATKLCFDRNGEIVSKSTAARAVGTTVSVAKLFSPLPVRRKELERNVKHEYGKLATILQSYALISSGVRLLCSNLAGKSTSRSILIQTEGSLSLRGSILAVFGSKVVNFLQELDFPLFNGVSVNGFISKPGPGTGKPSGSFQFFFLNKRPIELPKFTKVLNEIYKIQNPSQMPISVLNLSVPYGIYDVNVSPDKRKVMLQYEGEILEAFRKGLEGIYSPDSLPLSLNQNEGKIGGNKGDNIGKRQRGNDASEESSGESEGEEDWPNEGIVGGKLGEEVEEKGEKGGKGGELGLEKPVRNSGEIGEKIERNFWRKGGGNSGADPANEKMPAVTKRTRRSLVMETLGGFSLGGKTGGENGGEIRGEIRGEVRGKLGENEKKSKEQRSLLGFISREKREIKDFSMVGQGGREEGEIEGGNGGEMVEIRGESGVTEGEDSEENEENEGRSLGEDQGNKGNEEESLGEEWGEEEEIGEKGNEKIEETKELEEIREEKLEFDFETVKKKSLHLKKVNKSQHCQLNSHGGKLRFLAASLAPSGAEKGENSLLEAERELQVNFNKADFQNMKVIGQFNLGFIVGKLGEDLFIVDQHASDEKYNFERLARTTVLNRQPLIRPVPLDLTPAEEIVVMSHLETFRRNGFEIFEDSLAVPGHRLKLSSLPLSRNVTFGKSDFQELVALLENEPIREVLPEEGTAVLDMSPPCEGHLRGDQTSLDSNSNSQTQLEQPTFSGTVPLINFGGSLSRPLIRPSRVRSMLASRACRSSIMIGTALTKSQMEKILKNLSTLDSPWNCPHGRPTMRHLLDLSSLKK